MIFFYIPLYYTFFTRLKEKSRALAWFTTYLIPSSSMFFLLSDLPIVIDDIILYFLLMITVYSIYELGYIHNDCITIKNEVNPTLRLTEHELLYFYKNKWRIYFYRGVMIVLLNVFIYDYFLATYDFIVVLVSQVVLFLLFYIYNNVRNNLNLILQYFMCSLRYFLPILGLGVENYVYSMIILSFLYPILNVFEWTTKKRFSPSFMTKFSGNIPLIRVLYYLVTTIIFVFIDHYNLINDVVPVSALLYVSLYFLLYRLSIYTSLKFKFVK